MLLDEEGAVVVRDETELLHFVRRCLEDAAYAACLGRRAQSLVQDQRGAAERTLKSLYKLVDDQPISRRAA